MKMLFFQISSFVGDIVAGITIGINRNHLSGIHPEKPYLKL
jgi:hypothetical protein